MPPKVKQLSLPPSLSPQLPSFYPSSPQQHFIKGVSDGSSCSVKRNLFSFSANRTEADRRYEPRWFDMGQTGWIFGWWFDQFITATPHPLITSHLIHGVWSHKEVNYCKELQEVLFSSTPKIIPKSAKGKGLYNPYLIVIMYITMDTLINKTMSKSMEVTLKVYT